MAKIILIGFMGAGKTTLGNELSKKLGLPFVDSDQEVEKLLGKTVDEVFEQDGEQKFRSTEKQILDVLKAIDMDFILAVGGGLPCHSDLMDVLNSMGSTIYLKCSPQILAERLKNETILRPLVKGLQGEELLNYIVTKLAEREDVYNKADVVLSEDHSAEAILRHLPLRKN